MTNKESIVNVLKLTPLQSIRIYGLFNPKKFLKWDYIKDNEKVTLPFLISEGLELQNLRRIQPRFEEWVETRKVSVRDIHLFYHWGGIDLFDAFKLDISAFLQNSSCFRPDYLLGCGITWTQLKRRGFKYDYTVLMEWTFEDWKTLGMKEDVKSLFI